MASSSSRPRITPLLPRPSRGQIVWWVVGGVVAVAAFASVALTNGNGESQTNGEGAAAVDLHPVIAADGVTEPELLLAA